MERPIGVLLMTFGAAATLDDIPAYLTRVRGGRPVSEEVVAEFRRRYEVVGGSPLIRITTEQAIALETLLNNRQAGIHRFRVLPGMRHTPPFIADAVRKLASEGVRLVIAIILAPQHSPIIMDGYHRAVQEVSGELGDEGEVVVARAWHEIPNFVAALSKRVRESLAEIPQPARDTIPLIFTAHSIPKNVADEEPYYLEMLRSTALAVTNRVGLSPVRWQFAYQSAAHTPESWLTPDIKDLFPELRRQGYRRVLVVPVQFLSDHLEVLYDIDVAASMQAKEAGIELRRIEMPNTMPELIEALADVVDRELILRSHC